jgi:hypothetical protein
MSAGSHTDADDGNLKRMISGYRLKNKVYESRSAVEALAVAVLP